MRVFVTGATGFVGSAVVRELVDAGHQVLGLSRTEEGAKAITAAGARVHRGSLEDVDSLKRGAAEADAVVHTAFVHDFSNLQAAGKTDLAATLAIGDALAGSNRPFITTSGLGFRKPGEVTNEDVMPDLNAVVSHRAPSEVATLALAARGVRAMLMRLPPSVHGAGDHGFVPMLIDIARAKGAAAYPGDGTNRWPAVHRLDAAKLYRLALEKGTAGASYLAVADEGVPVRELAEVFGRRLRVPVVSKALGEETLAHFGWLGRFFSLDCPASSAKTQALLQWRPEQPGLLADVDAAYFPK